MGKRIQILLSPENGIKPTSARFRSSPEEAIQKLQIAIVEIAKTTVSPLSDIFSGQYQ